MTEIQVVKRDGTKQPLDLDRFHKVVMFACEGITGVSPSEIELNSRIQFYDGIKTADIQETLIRSAANLITEETPNYQWVAGRLVTYHLRKQVYGQFQPISVHDHVRVNVAAGRYDRELLNVFDENDYAAFEKIIDHDRDYLLTYAATEQFRSKYLIKDRTTGEIFETPQMAYLLIAATLFARYPKHTRMTWIKDYYDAISCHEISLPTPILNGVRTPDRQFASCTLVECGDSLNSIIATSGAIVKYISERAGLGIGGQLIRSEGSSVRRGTKKHTGKIPFWKLFQAAVKSCSQGGLRGGSATMNYMFFDLEVDALIPLKNNGGTEDTRIRHMDYCIHINKLLLQRFIDGGNITLFSPNDIPEVVAAFYSDDYDAFVRAYETAERKRSIRKRTISADDLVNMIVEERAATGRLYVMFADHVNAHGSFIPQRAPIKMTNLCVEITLPTAPLEHIDDDSGEIALCILSALNLAALKTPEDFKRLSQLAVRGLNALIDYQEYLLPAAEKSTLGRRPLGIGLINLAYWMAKNSMTFSGPDLSKIDEMMEAVSYHLIEASCDVAEETQPCPMFVDTRYSQGIFPVDTYKKDVDSLVSRELTYDWDALRERVRRVGMANSTLMAFMPSETSSQVAGATSGVDPVRALVMFKDSKDGSVAQVVPESRKLKNAYQMLWDITDMRPFLSVMAVIQKWTDQSISTNTSYNPSHFPDGEITADIMIRDLLYAYKYGLKTLYYNNTLAVANDGDGGECEACTL